MTEPDPDPAAVDVGGFLSDLPTFELRDPTLGYEPLTMERLNLLMAAYAKLPPIEPIRLTQEQWDKAKAAIPEAPAWSPRPFFSVPVHIVERVEDSTPYRLWLEKLTAEYGAVPFPDCGEWTP